MHADAKAGAAKADATDEAVSKHEQEKVRMPATCASAWDFSSHNHPRKYSEAVPKATPQVLVAARAAEWLQAALLSG